MSFPAPEASRRNSLDDQRRRRGASPGVSKCENVGMSVANGGMVRLAGGRFQMGTDESAIERLQAQLGVRRREVFEAEVPAHTVEVGPFEMDVAPVTNAQLQAFVAACPEWGPDRLASEQHNGDYLRHWENGVMPEALANHPVVYVTWPVALAYARWAGKRLPTEAEWEFAARGGAPDALFPWGAAPADPARANYVANGLNTTTPVRRYPPNPYGLHDLAGNVWEFCLDEWQPGWYATLAGHITVNPLAGDLTLARLAHLAPGDLRSDSLGAALYGGRRVIRGGSWGGSPVNLRVAYRDSHPALGAGNHVGFRCARSAP